MVSSSSNSFGFSENVFKLVKDSFIQFNEIKKVVLFGSRAMGNYKEGSDIDLAIFGEDVHLSTLSHLSNLLNEELPIPYFVDVVHFDSIEVPALKEHILSQGIVIYKRS